MMFSLRWRLRQLSEALQIGAAALCPRWLVYRCAIRLGAHATVGKYGYTVVPELTFIDALQRWRLR